MRHTKYSGGTNGAKVDRIIREADEFYRQYDFDNAMKLYSAAVKAGDKDRAPAMFLTLMARTGDSDKALKIANEIISKDPNNWPARACRASIFAHKNRFHEAIADCIVVVKKEPGHKEIYADMGYTLSALGMHEESVEAYRKSVEMIPYDADSVYSMCSELEILDRYPEALDLLKKYRDNNPDLYHVYMHMGRVYGKMGDWGRAHHNHVKAISPPPLEPGEPTNSKKMIHYRRIMNITKRARMSEPTVYSLFELAVALLSVGWREHAINVLDTVTRMKPTYMAYMMMGEISERYLHLRSAIKYYEHAIEFAGKTNINNLEAAFANLVRCTSQCGRLRDALKYSRKAKHLGINNEEIDEIHSVILREYGEDPEDHDAMAAGWTAPEMF